MTALPALFAMAMAVASSLNQQETSSEPPKPPPPPGVSRVGNGVSGPKLIHKVEPSYTKEARAQKIEGTVLLYVQITPNGRATNFKVLHPLKAGLNEKAIEAVKKWKFAPGMKDGKPVTVEAQIEVNFRLR